MDRFSIMNSLSLSNRNKADMNIADMNTEEKEQQAAPFLHDTRYTCNLLRYLSSPLNLHCWQPQPTRLRLPHKLQPLRQSSVQSSPEYR